MALATLKICFLRSLALFTQRNQSLIDTLGSRFKTSAYLRFELFRNRFADPLHLKVSYRID
jgi:hypothetical protein